MTKQFQVTLTATNGKYKPVSTIVTLDDSADKKTIQTEGIKKICVKRYWNGADLKRLTYTKVKVREYDREKIEKENMERYAQIKEQKYASGEWKRPKKDLEKA